MTVAVSLRRSVMVVLLVLLAGGYLPRGAQSAETPAGKPPRVYTVDDQVLTARITGLQDGHLVLEGTPPRRLPLDDVARIECDVKRVLSATWIGQQPDVEKPGQPSTSGKVPKLHIVLNGLPEADSISQISVRCGPERWDFQAAPSQTGQPVARPKNAAQQGAAAQAGGRLLVRRAGGSDTADLFFDGKPGDYFNRFFAVNVTFEKAGLEKARIAATTHTKSDAKSPDAKNPDVKTPNPKSTAPQPAGATADAKPAQAILFLQGPDRLTGELLSLGQESLKFRTRWQTELEIPLVQVRGVGFPNAELDATDELFQRHLAAPGSTDAVIARSKDQTPAAVTGHIESLAGGKLQLSFEGEVRPIQQSRLVGLVFAAHPRSVANQSLYQIFALSGGDKISGTWSLVSGEAWQLQTAWGIALRLPPAAVTGVTFINGKLVYLSDLPLASVDEVPYFDHRWPYRRDQSLLGQPLRSGGETFAKGLAVHARCALTYTLDAHFATFRATVGFDEGRSGLGRVSCRVLADGRELYAEKDLRGDQKPVRLNLNMAGVRKLTLEVDFGESEDTGDRIIWGDARLLRTAGP